MERLALVSHVLYNKDILDKAKEIDDLKSQIIVEPSIVFENWGEWDSVVDMIYVPIKDWIINCVNEHYDDILIGGLAGTDEQESDLILEFSDVIYDELYNVTQNHLWCLQQCNKIVASITYTFTVLGEMDRMDSLFSTPELLRKFWHKMVRLYLGGRRHEHGGILFNIPCFKCSECSKVDKCHTELGLCYDCNCKILDSPVN